jgi:hypothetical protein
VRNQASPSAVPNCCWPNTNNTLPTRLANFGDSGVALGSAGVPVAYYGPFAIFATQKQCFYDSATEEQYLLPKTNDKNQSTRATTTAQLPTTPSSPHSGKPRRGAALTYPNVPYFVVGGGKPIRIHNAHALWCKKKGQIELYTAVNALDF